jgi:type II secretory pathway pseudopilin PulG
VGLRHSTIRRCCISHAARRVRAPGREVHVAAAGFTLLELMISFTLLGMMLAMVFSVFATATDAIPRGEAAAERSARLRMATALMTRQIRSLVDYPAETEDEEIHPFFSGDANHFTFITAAPQLGRGDGLGWVTYWVDEAGNLNLSERLIFSAGTFAGDEPESSAEAILLAGIASHRFEYLRLEGDESEWVESWDGLEEQVPPAAIRVTIDGLGLGDSYWIQEIPIMTVVYSLGTYDSDLGSFFDADDGFGFEDEDEDEFDE